MNEKNTSERTYNILAFGIEKLNLPIPSEPIRSHNYSIHFERFTTHRRFQEYDGVITFQGIFEHFEKLNGFYENHLIHKYDADELDKRKKETKILLEEGGFICFLLTDTFIDTYKGRDYSATDLAKFYLKHPDFNKRNLNTRQSHVVATADEFKRFLDIYGAANSQFNNNNSSLEFQPLAKLNGATVGMVLDRSQYFLPSLVPSARHEVVKEYFELLADAITSVHNKLHVSVPEWAKDFHFKEEPELEEQKRVLLESISRINERIALLDRYKSALIQTGADLVSTVGLILIDTLGVSIDQTEEYREDIKLLGEDGDIIAICEIKGINRGIKRENINQTDSHRERSQFDEKFPALLIVNTNIKSARSLAEKRQEIASEQIRHAVNMHILIMRTIDLISLLRLVLSSRTTKQEALSLILNNKGWLRVEDDKIQVMSE